MLSLEYIAGFFDADGNVSIIRTVRGNGIKYVLRVEACNCYAPVIEALKARFGGTAIKRSITQRKDRDPNELGIRDTFVWCCGSLVAARFLEAILPYMFIKKEEAKVALEFQRELSANHSNLPLSDAQIESREHLANLCSSLKKQRYDFHSTNVVPVV